MINVTYLGDTVNEYEENFSSGKILPPKFCPSCGHSVLHLHGHYLRWAINFKLFSRGKRLRGVPIQPTTAPAMDKENPWSTGKSTEDNFLTPMGSHGMGGVDHQRRRPLVLGKVSATAGTLPMNLFYV
jgi:hypothetical protein